MSLVIKTPDFRPGELEGTIDQGDLVVPTSTEQSLQRSGPAQVG